MTRSTANVRLPSSLDRLRVLEVLLRTGTPAAASRELGITQSAVSHTLSKLRAELGDPLLVRRGDRMLLTPLGERLRKPLSIALDTLRRTLEDVPNDLHRPALSIAMRDQFAVALGQLLVVRLTRESRELRVVSYDREQISDQLARGDFDLAIAVDPPQSPNLRTRTLYREHFVLMSQKKAVPSVDDYFAARHVVTTAHPEYVDTESAIARMGRVRNVAVRVPYFAAAVHLVERSGLLAMVPSRVADALRSDRVYVHAPPFQVPAFRVCLVWDVRFDKSETNIRQRKLVVDAVSDLAPLRNPTTRRSASA